MSDSEESMIRRVFRKFVDVEDPAELLGSELRALDYGPIGIALVATRGRTPEETSENMGRVADLAGSYDGVADSMVSGVVIVTFGTLSILNEADRQGFVMAVGRDLSESAKVLHGVWSASYGTFGSANRMSYTFLMPDFLEAMSDLRALPWGESHEIGKSWGESHPETR